MTRIIERRRLPTWRTVATGLGLVWSLYGIFQYWMGTTSSEAGLMASGMTPSQAALYAGLPPWMNIVFAVGVFGGALGCALLLARHALARPMLAASLAGYVILFIGDIVEGVFTAFGPPQVVVLSVAVAIAAGLVWLASTRRG